MRPTRGKTPAPSSSSLNEKDPPDKTRSASKNTLSLPSSALVPSTSTEGQGVSTRSKMNLNASTRREKDNEKDRNGVKKINSANDDDEELLGLRRSCRGPATTPRSIPILTKPPVKPAVKVVTKSGIAASAKATDSAARKAGKKINSPQWEADISQVGSQVWVTDFLPDWLDSKESPLASDPFFHFVKNGHKLREVIYKEATWRSVIVVDRKNGLDLKVAGNDIDEIIDSIDKRKKRKEWAIKAHSQTVENISLGQFRRLYKQDEYVRRTEPMNILGLEVTDEERLKDKITTPLIYREMSLVHHFWRERSNNELDVKHEAFRPITDRYVLLTMGGCYTDFHVDYTASATWLHITKGTKVFIFAPPTAKNLEIYEEWRSEQLDDGEGPKYFVGDRLEYCRKVIVKEGQTVFIAPGWLHAVFTPANSIAFSGSIICRNGMHMQLRLSELEDNAGFADNLKFTHFRLVYWYVGITIKIELEESFKTITDRSARSAQDADDEESAKNFARLVQEGLTLQKHLIRWAKEDEEKLHELEEKKSLRKKLTDYEIEYLSVYHTPPGDFIHGQSRKNIIGDFSAILKKCQKLPQYKRMKSFVATEDEQRMDYETASVEVLNQNSTEEDLLQSTSQNLSDSEFEREAKQQRAAIRRKATGAAADSQAKRAHVDQNELLQDDTDMMDFAHEIDPLAMDLSEDQHQPDPEALATEAAVPQSEGDGMSTIEVLNRLEEISNEEKIRNAEKERMNKLLAEKYKEDTNQWKLKREETDKRAEKVRTFNPALQAWKRRLDGIPTSERRKEWEKDMKLWETRRSEIDEDADIVTRTNAALDYWKSKLEDTRRRIMPSSSQSGSSTAAGRGGGDGQQGSSQRRAAAARRAEDQPGTSGFQSDDTIKRRKGG